MYRVGTIGKATMREFDESRLVAPAEIKPAQIKQLREKICCWSAGFSRGYLSYSAKAR